MIKLIDMFLHIDRYLSIFISHYGGITYLLIFVILFCETGLVVTPFLPGDSVLFTVGALSGMGMMNVWQVYFICLAAAILGDSANYSIGANLGKKLIKNENSKLIKREHLIKAQTFYDEHGVITIILARFVPIVRTFAPFIAGMSKMHYKTFFRYNIIGAILWTLLFVFCGYFFGNLSIVKNNFSFIIIAIVLVSVVVGLVSFTKSNKSDNNAENPSEADK